MTRNEERIEMYAEMPHELLLQLLEDALESEDLWPDIPGTNFSALNRVSLALLVVSYET